MTLERCHLNWEEMTLELDVLVGFTIGQSFLFFCGGGGGPTRFSCVSLHELEFKKIKEVQNGNAAEKCDENMAWKTVFHNRQSHFLVQTSSGAEEGGCCPFVRFPK